MYNTNIAYYKVRAINALAYSHLPSAHVQHVHCTLRGAHYKVRAINALACSHLPSTHVQHVHCALQLVVYKVAALAHQ
jgi:hypothetical protein